MRLAIAMLVSALWYGLLAYRVLDSSTAIWLIALTLTAGIGPLRLLKVFFGIWLVIRVLGG